jgi:DNA polymerase-1
MKKLIIIDSHSILYKSHFAFGTRQLSNSKGMVTSALFGFTRAFLTMLQKFVPDYICFAFDKSRETFRRKMYEPYKAHRSETPPELRTQFPFAEKIAESLGIRTIKIDGFEADDILGTLSAMLTEKHPELEAMLVTGDKDSFQLAAERINIAYTSSKSKDGYIIYDPEKIRSDYGIEPIELIQVKALQGDSSDNIPGIRGIGEKTALKLIQEHHNLENIYQHIDSFKGALRQKLETGKADAELSRTLATICKTAPLSADLPELSWNGEFPPDFIALMEELEFQSLLKALNLKKASETNSILKTDSRPEVAPAAPAEPLNKPCQWHTVLTRNELQELLEKLAQSPLIAFDTETSSLNPYAKCLVGISFSVEPFVGYYIPLHHRYLGVPTQLDENLVISELKKIFSLPDKIFIAHNIKFDIAVLENYGIEFPAEFQDTMLLSHLLNPLERHGLKHLAEVFLQVRREDFKQMVSGKNGSFADVCVKAATAYSGADSENTLRLYQIFQPQMEKRPELQKLCSKIEQPLLKILLQMEREGVYIDQEHFRNLASELEKNIRILHDKIMEMTGENFNLNSPKQLSEVLFDKLKIDTTGLKKKTSGYSTAIDVLEKLADSHPVCALIAEYRHLAKLLGTYVNPLPLLTDENNRLHTSFSQTTVATGRLSSLEPNLQNIPVRTEWGRKIRQGFIPSTKERLLVSIDYSQIELRVLAHICGDENLKNAFHAGRDIHTETAAKVFGVEDAEVTKTMRESSKAINFGIIYGMGAFSLSNQLKISQIQAKEFINTYFKVYPDIREFMDSTEKEAKAAGGIYTMFGRFRPIPEINSANGNKRDGARRVAINSRIQGSAAEIIKKAMLVVAEFLHSRQCATRMILQVHDELLFDVPEQELNLMPEIKKLMENVIDFSVPLACDMETGRNWGDLKPYEI